MNRENVLSQLEDASIGHPDGQDCNMSRIDLTVKTLTVNGALVGGGGASDAYTQTYATAARTVPDATVVAQVTTALVDAVTGNFAYDTAAQGEAIPVAINALAADVLAIKKVLTALIDDLQARKTIT